MYFITIYSYEEKAQQIIQDKLDLKINGSSEFHFKGELIARSPYEINTKLTSRYPSILREFLFIRLMSLLETFFYETLGELSQITNLPFRNNKDINYKVGELLSIDDIQVIKKEIINTEIRSIVSQGFKEIDRFFSKLNIIFSNSGVNLKQLGYLYDIRNLLIHNNGVVDDYFIHKHSYQDKSKKIIITEELLLETISILNKLSKFIYSGLDNQFSLVPKKVKDRKVKSPRESDDEVIIEEAYKASFFIRDNLKNLLNDDFQFGFSNTYKFIEIKSEVTVLTEYEAQWTVVGSRKVIGEYRGFLRKMKRLGYFQNLEMMKVRSEEH
ncbi:hypothetical protein [Paenibacillus hubeiensis]|uniref:hypothetical protein n=1 Tax=Paenibacillus hubeiensis TaxID=3077330 RepID=UPI0031BAB656